MQVVALIGLNLASSMNYARIRISWLLPKTP